MNGYLCEVMLYFLPLKYECASYVLKKGFLLSFSVANFFLRCLITPNRLSILSEV